MRIRTFCKFVEVSELTPLVLRDATVVVDGQNFFYTSYETAGLTSTFGIESDRYARYLRQYLSMFKKANVKCYFLFKGGHENLQRRLQLNEYNWPTVPTLMKEIYKQVLHEMDLEFVVCEYESKKDIIALAQNLNCPVISNDIEFCFSGIQYIPSRTLEFNDRDNTINCGSFLIADFLKKYRMTAEKVAVFIVLTDERIFPEGFFSNLFRNLKAPLGPYKRNLHLLKWLSMTREGQISKTIFKFISAEDEKKFVEEEIKARSLIERRDSGGLGAACLLDRGAGAVARADPRWFAKGVAAGHIAIDYVNLYRSKVVLGAPLITGFEDENVTLVSLDIIMYAYDLLTDFKNDGFTFVYEIDYNDEGKMTIKVPKTNSIRKPAYEAEQCVFENGWSSVRSLGLLEHFVREALSTSLRRLERAPEEARLPLLALAYFSRRRPAAPRALPAAALLAYVALDLLHDKADNNDLPRPPFDRKPILDSTTDKNAVTAADCGIAAAVLEEYFHASDSDAEHMLDRSLLHPLAEFQQCLLQLSALNALCGAELRAPVFSRTYNGTLAYKLLRAAHQAADPTSFLDHLLSPAPTVYAFFNGLLETYEDILNN